MVRSISVDSSAFSATESTSNYSIGLNRRGSSANDDDDAFEDDFMDSEPSTHSDMSSLNSASHHNLNILSRSLLSNKALIQHEACLLLVKWSYLVSECGSLCWSSIKSIINDVSCIAYFMKFYLVAMISLISYTFEFNTSYLYFIAGFY